MFILQKSVGGGGGGAWPFQTLKYPLTPLGMKYLEG